ncbi:hypothetical protein LXA43DRAFT_1105751 [Ganoderma leucocontextum]|nr:hypothetical protein LXA43DRAFT_1105751 [Ganoderma leucocontextum]
MPRVEMANTGHKRKAKSTTGKLKTPAHSGTSTPALKAATQVKSKKFKGALAFEELTKSEEKTRQMELKVIAEKLRYNMKKVKVKMECEKNKMEVIRLKFELHKERQQPRYNTPPIVHHNDSILSIPSLNGFALGSQTPAMTFSEDMYNFGVLRMEDSAPKSM